MSVYNGNVFTRTSFDLAIHPLYPALCSYAARRSGRQEAPDLVQQALLTSWTVIERFDAAKPPGELFAWLSRFVDYAIDEYFRSRADDSMTTSLSEHEDIFSGLCAEQEGDMTERRVRELRHLITRANLTVRQRQTVESWLEGMSQLQIAQSLHIAPSSVWQHISAAAKRIRRVERSEEYLLMEIWYEETHRSVYSSPASVGARLSSEHLASLAAMDASNAARCRSSRRR